MSNRAHHPVNCPHSFYTEAAGRFMSGITLREHYAGLAMQALLSATNSEGTWTGITDATVKEAVLMADNLIAELERTRK